MKVHADPQPGDLIEIGGQWCLVFLDGDVLRNVILTANSGVISGSMEDESLRQNEGLVCKLGDILNSIHQAHGDV